jgi:energy-converting hydrogenase Eha subunit E
VKTRHVFSTPDLATAKAAMQAARVAGVSANCISLVARSDVELEQMPEQHREAHSDFFAGAARGVVGGGGTGLLAGLVAVAIPPIGVTLAGVVALAVAGAMVGGWTGAIAGASVPDPVRRRFETEIQAGRILVVLDGDKHLLAAAEPALVAAGATPLPFETPTALS